MRCRAAVTGGHSPRVTVCDPGDAPRSRVADPLPRLAGEDGDVERVVGTTGQLHRAVAVQLPGEQCRDEFRWLARDEERKGVAGDLVRPFEMVHGGANLVELETTVFQRPGPGSCIERRLNLEHSGVEEFLLGERPAVHAV